MQIILTHGYFLYEDEKEQAIMKPYPPLGLLYISAYLESKGFDNDIYDSTFGSFADFTAYLEEKKPDLLGIYVNLMTKINVLRIMRFVQDHPALQHTRIVLGGPEVRHHCENFLDHGADIIVFGEGEETMYELARHFANNDGNSPHEISGIAYRTEDHQTIRTGERALLQNLDELPLPNRKKIDLQKYFDTWRQHHGYAMLSMNTMRGCPYGCKWCSRAVYGQSYRRRSPAQVVEGLALLRSQYDFDKVWFVDDVFTISHKWLRQFAEEVKARQLSIPYEAISRADRMNEEVVQLLKESGCFRIWIGAESGSQQVLDAMNRMVRIEKVKEAVARCKQYGIETGTFIMLGYPGETAADIRQTLDYLLDADPDHFTITLAYPIKGTPFYEEVEAKMINTQAWETSTDRDIDFERPFSKAYYERAIRWIHHEVAFQKQKRAGGLTFLAVGSKLRSAKARLGMKVYK